MGTLTQKLVRKNSEKYLHRILLRILGAISENLQSVEILLLRIF